MKIGFTDAKIFFSEAKIFFSDAKIFFRDVKILSKIANCALTVPISHKEGASRNGGDAKIFTKNVDL